MLSPLQSIAAPLIRVILYVQPGARTRRLSDALSLLNLKSEEIQRLGRELAEEQEKRAKLEQELATATLKAVVDSTSASAQTGNHRNQREAERLIWDVERATWLQEREEQAAWKAQLAAWENERAAWDADRAKLVEQLETATTSLATLTSSVDLLTRGKLSAEKDRELFREKYAEASEYAMTVRRENIELEERANIAESQAKDGVAMVKGMFESQVKMLKNDVARWKGIAELMQEKDRLTGDDIRRRAAEEPELRERCHWLVDNFNSLEADFRQMGNTQLKLVTERNKLEKKVLKLQTERNALRSKLENASLQDANGIIDDVHAMNGASSESDANEDDDYAWFPCKWRPDGPDQCGYTFDCVEVRPATTFFGPCSPLVSPGPGETYTRSRWAFRGFGQLVYTFWLL
ncbi:hypothetical protein BV22DRAFT_1011593 [Leucogyrophana mollusca]|uniref:Uncharacterized protein n=1 Tax=Leucogyrophana mollusca TaxID=85980 RepID=A0ACB8BI88_9AGAM|nr:hypothetical protein BV22DRAFT_1011593 [Leucogyrophana mollusca]